MEEKDNHPEENTCVVCFKGVNIYSIGQCDHPVCFECSTRMRVVCRQNECPICRQEMPKVIFKTTIEPFEKIKNVHKIPMNKFNIGFWSAHEKNAYDQLLAHNCPICPKSEPNFSILKNHVRKVHSLYYCDLCVDNLKILTSERRCYTRQDLATHRRLGDVDDRSHRGHPLCEFCDTRYMDSDELFRHLRRDHLFCHFCDADGLHYYYNSYDSLRQHFQSEHYLCEEGDCYNEKFTSVFRTDIDLKAHKASVHGRGLSKLELKQTRTLDIEFTLAPRQRPVHQRRDRHAQSQRDDDRHVGAVGGAVVDLAHQQTEPKVDDVKTTVFTQLNTNCTEEFPSLGATNSNAPPVPHLTRGPSRKVTATISSRLHDRNGLYDENFPALGPDSTSVSLRVNTVTTPAPAQPTNVSIQVSHPRFKTTLSSANTYNQHFPALENGSSGTTSLPSSTQTAATSALSAPSSSSGHEAPQWAAKKQQLNKPSSINQKSNKRPQTIPHHNLTLKMDDFPALAPVNNVPIPVPRSKSSVLSNSQSSQPKKVSETLRATSTSSAKKKSKSKTSTSNATNIVVGANVKKKGGIMDDEYSYQPNSVFEASNKKIKEVNLVSESSNQSTGPAKENKGFKSIKVNEESFPALGTVASIDPPVGPDLQWSQQVNKRPPASVDNSHSSSSVTESKINSSTVQPPPGFRPLGESFPPLVDNPGGGPTFYPPPNFEKRNAALVKKIGAALGNAELKDFKEVSVAFRSNLLSAADYYKHCREIMGADSFTVIFPELLSLLPDIKKQQELWPLYKNDKRRFEESAFKGHRLDCCNTCFLVLRSNELREHLSKHSLDTHFPALNSKSHMSSNAWTK